LSRFRYPCLAMVFGILNLLVFSYHVRISDPEFG
jgi:hypothetical protein